MQALTASSDRLSSLREPDRSLRVLFLTRSLERGGAERQLVTLARALAQRDHDVHVAVFYPGGPLAAELADSPVHLHTLDKRGRWDLVGFALRLARLLGRVRPTILHGYLIAPNLLVALMARLAGPARVVWGVRASAFELDHYDWLHRWSFEAGRALSRRADLIISNSRAGLEHHRQRGYPAARMIWVPNGIDTDRFRPDRPAGRPLREEWGIPAECRLVGLVARIDPMKDHATFLAAAGHLARQRQDVRFVCVGGGPAERRAALERRTDELGLGSRLVWAGPHSNMVAVYNALDLVVSSSAFGEGFSNTIGEALACGVPCVVTDVGDSALLVGPWGRVVPPRDPVALAAACEQALDAVPSPDPWVLHHHVATEYSVARLVERTERAFAELVGRTGDAACPP